MRQLPFALLAMCCAFAIAACGNDAPAPASPVASAQQEAVSRVGDVTIRATALPTAALAAEVAERYGIARDDRSVMLLVGVRQGPEGQDSAVPATITATVTRLGGQPQTIALRELRSGDLLDYVGTVDTSLPDTLRFDLIIVREGGARSTMQFSREFHPR